MKTSLKVLTEQFRYLDMLRESGRTNMLRAWPYIEEEFSLSKDEAKLVLHSWIKSFSVESPEVRAKSFVEKDA